MADRKLEGGLNGGEAPAVQGVGSRQAREFMREAAALHAAAYPGGCSASCEACVKRVTAAVPAVARFSLSESEVGLLVLALRDQALETRQVCARMRESKRAAGRLAEWERHLVEIEAQAVKLDGWADAFEGESVTVEVRS